MQYAGRGSSAMAVVKFAIGEWLVCPECGMVCDAPFQPEGSDATEPELVLGQSLPESQEVPGGEWHVMVAARCPRCRVCLSALAQFDSRTLREFHLLSASDPRSQS